MPSGSGLDAQLGIKAQSSYFTAATVDRFLDFDSETLSWAPNFREPTGIRPGRHVKRGSRLAVTRTAGSGGITLQHSTRNMGLLWKQALHSAVVTPTVIVAPAYRQVHQLRSNTGFPVSCTLQVGRPEPESGTVRAHTFIGCTCTGWEFTVSDAESAMLSLEYDIRDEDLTVPLATATYPAGDEVFDFSDATVFKLGGTPSTASGVVSIAGGTQVTTVVTEFSLSGENPMAVERYGLGNAGKKNQPRYNEFVGVTGSLTAEYNQTEIYSPFKNGTSTALQLSLLGSAVGASVNTLDFVAPMIRWKNVGPAVGGPDLVTQSAEFEVYDNDIDNALQVTIISADSTAL